MILIIGIIIIIAIVYLLTVIFHIIDNNIELTLIKDVLLNPNEIKFEAIFIKYYQIYLVIIFISILLIYLETFKKKRGRRDGAEYGSSKWSKSKNLKKLYNKSGVIINKKFIMSLDSRKTNKNNNMLIIGGSGTMKTRSFVIPNILQANTSYVITDPKGEILRKAGSFLEKKGYEVLVLNLVNMSKSQKYNPLHNLKVDIDVLKLTQTIINNTSDKNAVKGDPFWEKSETALISALIFYLWKEKSKYEMTFKNIISLLEEAIAEEDETSIVDIIFKNLEESKGSDHLAVKQYKVFRQAKGSTRASILVSVAVRLAPFSLPEINELTSDNEIDIEGIGNKKVALFIIISDSDSTFNFLSAIMYTQLFDLLFRKADASDNGRLSHHIQFVLDEFANIGRIPDFDQKIATMRSREISVKIILQTITQLKTMYKDSWETISGNCDTLLFLGGSETATLKYVSEILGKQTITVNTHSSKSQGLIKKDINESFGAVGRELMTVDELYRLDNRYSILLIRGNFPIKESKYQLKKHMEYKHTSEYSIQNEYIFQGHNSEKEIIISQFQESDISDFCIDIKSQIQMISDDIENLSDEEMNSIKHKLISEYELETGDSVSEVKKIIEESLN